MFWLFLHYPGQDFPLVPLSLCSSNENYCTSVSLQCSALHRRALLSESLWQLQRLAGNWARLPSSSSVKSDGFDQLGASRGRLCSSPCSMLHWTETAHTHTHSSTGGVLSMLWRDWELTSVRHGLAQHEETSFTHEYTWHLWTGGWD